MRIPTTIIIPLSLMLACGVAAAQPTPPELKAQCTEALKNDKDWNAALFEQVKVWHAGELKEIADARHEQEGAKIAKDKKHVILAYAAMWLLSVGFLVFLWRRQQALRAHIDQLKVELDKALKEGK
jgi:hypothetical protein